VENIWIGREPSWSLTSPRVLGVHPHASSRIAAWIVAETATIHPEFAGGQVAVEVVP